MGIVEALVGGIASIFTAIAANIGRPQQGQQSQYEQQIQQMQQQIATLNQQLSDYNRILAEERTKNRMILFVAIGVVAVVMLVTMMRK